MTIYSIPQTLSMCSPEQPCFKVGSIPIENVDNETITHGSRACHPSRQKHLSSLNNAINHGLILIAADDHGLEED